MAHAETTIVHACMKRASELGARLGKNTRGMFRMLRGEERVKAGLLIPGASDLIGFYPIVITTKMVGKRVAAICCAEVKTETGRPSQDQLNFIEQVKIGGGIAGIIRSPEDLEKMLRSYLLNLEI